MESINLSRRLIRTDGGTQPRSFVDYDAVDDYAEAMGTGAKFPPITVFYDGTDYWLADGFHRIAAVQQRGIDEVECDVDRARAKTPSGTVSPRTRRMG
jgi:uncharacterized ParB-like nuclease family protein